MLLKQWKYVKSKIQSGNPCKRFVSFNNEGNPVFKDKVKYNTKAEAKKKADEYNGRYNTIHYATPYLCPVCHKWHIGRSSVEITQYRKQQIKNKSFITESESELEKLREKIENAPKIDLSKI